MIKSFVWINKDAGSEKLSQSSRNEEAKIRQHVQQTRIRDKIAYKLGGGRHRARNDDFAWELDVDETGKCIVKPRTKAKKLKLSGKRFSTYKVPDILDTLPKALSYRSVHLSPAECRSFEFLQSRTCRELPGWRDFSFWNHLALQLAQTSKVVAHSLLSLAALHESWDNATGNARATDLRLLSLTQSSKATRAADAAEMTYLEALVSCLVSLCFNSLLHPRQAFRLLESGIKMLEEADRQNLNPSSTITSKEERQLIDSSIRPLFDRMRCRSCRMNDLCIAFSISARSRRRQNISKSALDLVGPPSIRASFMNIEAARDCLDMIFLWAHDHVPLFDEDVIPMQDFRHHIRLLCLSWEAALDSTTAAVDAVDILSTLRARLLLKAAALVGRIVIETCGAENEMIFDEYLSEFCQIIEVIDKANSSYQPASEISLGIDGGLIDILAFVGSKCRDPVIRRRAMHLLSSGRRVEGDRIAQLPGLILEALIDLEEHALPVISQDDIPEEHRRRVFCGHVFSDQGRIRIFFKPAPVVPDTTQDERDIITPGASPVMNTSHTTDAPDAIFGSGYAAFLEGNVSQHFQLNLESFYFPIPRV